ncbi:CsbD family protein [Sphingomonas sp. Tas61C01]|uniref:CsbD family protein n=1 Tax=Sphingomonas sp. Tas61C01 TaxID=3458297 RepID=UPI00403E633B
MEKIQIEGLAQEAKGSIKEAIGKLTGSNATEIEGTAERAAGKAQAAVGQGKTAVKDRLKS